MLAILTDILMDLLSLLLRLLVGSGLRVGHLALMFMLVAQVLLLLLFEFSCRIDFLCLYLGYDADIVAREPAAVVVEHAVPPSRWESVEDVDDIPALKRERRRVCAGKRKERLDEKRRIPFACRGHDRAT